MNLTKRLLPALLCALLVLGGLPRATAAREIREDTDGGYSVSIPKGMGLSEVMAYYIQTYHLTEDNFAITFCCPETGEWYGYNEDTFMLAASTYKVPLNLYYYELQAAGEYTDDSDIKGHRLADIHRASIVDSNNELSHILIYNLGTFAQYKRLMLDRYGGMDEELIPSDYWSDNYYCTHFMANVLLYLYQRQDQFPELLDYMIHNQEGMFLQRYAGDTVVAHKYGYFEGQVHDIGITYTRQPFVVAIYTRGFSGGGIYAEELIARLNAALIAYQTQRTQALEEEAAAAAETAEAPTEETAAPQPTQPPAPETTAEPYAAQQARHQAQSLQLQAQSQALARRARVQNLLLLAVPAAVLVLGAVGVLLARKKRR